MSASPKGLRASRFACALLSEAEGSGCLAVNYFGGMTQVEFTIEPVKPRVFRPGTQSRGFGAFGPLYELS